MPVRAPRAQSQSGLTLIEIMVVVVIIAVASSAASIGLGALTKTNLRSACVRMMALSRYAYHRALTHATTVRLTLDLEQDTFMLSEAHGRVSLVRSDAPLRKLAADDDDVGDPGAAIDPWELAKARLAKPDEVVMPASPFSALQAPSGKPLKRFEKQAVGDDVRIAKVIVAHESEPRESGVADLFFFPNGLTQHAVVQLIDRNDVIYSIEIHPLTGRGTVHATPFEPEVLMDDPSLHNDRATELEDR